MEYQIFFFGLAWCLQMRLFVWVVLLHNHSLYLKPTERLQSPCETVPVSRLTLFYHPGLQRSGWVFPVRFQLNQSLISCSLHNLIFQSIAMPHLCRKPEPVCFQSLMLILSWEIRSQSDQVDNQVHIVNSSQNPAIHQK